MGSILNQNLDEGVRVGSVVRSDDDENLDIEDDRSAGSVGFDIPDDESALASSHSSEVPQVLNPEMQALVD